MSKEVEKKEEDFFFKCPSCKKGVVKISKSIYDLPDEDKMLILKFECDKCNFHNNDIIPLTTRIDPGIMVLKVSSEEDLRSKIYRSPTAKLEIPELELIVEPGPNADFYFTNIEGVLFKFENAVSIYRKNLENNDSQIEEIEDILKNLQKARKGQFPFTLKITDPEGGSYIIPVNNSKYTFEKR